MALHLPRGGARESGREGCGRQHNQNKSQSIVFTSLSKYFLYRGSPFLIEYTSLLFLFFFFIFLLFFVCFCFDSFLLFFIKYIVSNKKSQNLAKEHHLSSTKLKHKRCHRGEGEEPPLVGEWWVTRGRRACVLFSNVLESRLVTKEGGRGPPGGEGGSPSSLPLFLCPARGRRRRRLAPTSRLRTLTHTHTVQQHKTPGDYNKQDLRRKQTIRAKSRMRLINKAHLTRLTPAYS
jgi:hypothetical protein